MSTMLLMGRTPMERSRSRIHLGEGAILTLRTMRAVYRGTRSASGVSTSSRSASTPSAPPLTTGSWRARGASKVADTSRARPMTLRQSGRLGVISNSTTWSSALITGLMSSPGRQSSWRMKMPSGMQWGNSACWARRSARVQMWFSLVW